MFLTAKKKILLKRRFFRGKQKDTETPGDHWEKLIKLKKESPKQLISEFTTPITDKKLRDKLLKKNIQTFIKQSNKYNRTDTIERTYRTLNWKQCYQTEKKNSKRALSQNNIYGKIRNKIERKTKRTKMQILSTTKLHS